MDTLRNFLLVSLVVLLAIVLYKRLLKKMGAKKALVKYANFIAINSDGGLVKVKIEMPHTEEVKLSVFDQSENLVNTLHEGPLNEGEHEFTWERGQSTGDKYYCELKTKNQNATRYFS
jgi:flagellar hook assembly protein FlgD